MIKISAVALACSAALVFASAAQADVIPNAAIDPSPTYDSNITMTFNGDVDLVRTTVTVFGPHGLVSVGRLKQGATGGDIVIPVSGDLRPGIYVVNFTAYSSWGTPLKGTSTVRVSQSPSPGGYSGLKTTAEALGH